MSKKLLKSNLNNELSKYSITQLATKKQKISFSFSKLSSSNVRRLIMEHFLKTMKWMFEIFSSHHFPESNKILRIVCPLAHYPLAVFWYFSLSNSGNGTKQYFVPLSDWRVILMGSCLVLIFVIIVFRNMHFPNTIYFFWPEVRAWIFIFANYNIYQSIRAESIWQFICILGDTGHILSYFWLRGNYTGSGARAQ